LCSAFVVLALERAEVVRNPCNVGGLLPHLTPLLGDLRTDQHRRRNLLERSSTMSSSAGTGNAVIMRSGSAATIASSSNSIPPPAFALDEPDSKKARPS